VAVDANKTVNTPSVDGTRGGKAELSDAHLGDSERHRDEGIRVPVAGQRVGACADFDSHGGCRLGSDREHDRLDSLGLAWRKACREAAGLDIVDGDQEFGGNALTRSDHDIEFETVDRERRGAADPPGLAYLVVESADETGCRVTVEHRAGYRKEVALE
jgi:hypothetical protein